MTDPAARWAHRTWAALLAAFDGADEAADALVERCIAAGVDFIRPSPEESVAVLLQHRA